MARIITNTNTRFNDQVLKPGDVKDAEEFGPTMGKEPDFVELHTMFRIQYKQFLADTSSEIAKRAQRLAELKSIVYGNPSSK